MLNINAGHNNELMEKCPVLKGYAALVSYVREFQKQKKGFSIEEAVHAAVDRCIAEGLLAAYLKKKKSEVYLMLLTEFDEKLYEETIRAEGREEGREEARKEGREEGIERMAALISRLVADKRQDDLMKAAKDRVYREYLLKLYGI